MSNQALKDIELFTMDELEVMYPIEIDRGSDVVWDRSTFKEYDNITAWAMSLDVGDEEKVGDYSPTFIKRQRRMRDDY